MKRMRTPRRQPSELTLQIAEQMRAVQGTLKTHGRDVSILKKRVSRVERNDARQDRELRASSLERRELKRGQRELRRMLGGLHQGVMDLHAQFMRLQQLPEFLDVGLADLERKVQVNLDERAKQMAGVTSDMLRTVLAEFDRLRADLDARLPPLPGGRAT